MATGTRAANAELPSVAERVKLLVQCFVGDDDSQLSARSKAVLDFCMRIVTSRMSSSVVQDEILMADNIKKRLLKAEASTEKALQFSILFQKLQAKTSLRRKWSILHFLNLVGSQNLYADDIPVMDQSFATAGLHSFTTTAGGNEKISSSNTTEKPEKPHQCVTTNNTMTGYAHYLSVTSSNRVQEAALLKDMMYVFQGIDGKYVKYHTPSNTYKMDKHILVPQPERDLVERLAELGWMYKRLSGFLNDKSLDNGFGLVGQSFCSAIRRELAEYYRLIAVLESQIASSTTNNKATAMDEQDNENDNTNQQVTDELTRRGLTLKRLLVWSIDPLCRLQVAVSLVNSCRDHKGGALVSIIHTYVHHGDPAVSSFVHKILRAACEPFFTMLRAWVYEGELIDPYDEFFVALQPDFKEGQWWKSKYNCRPEMIPDFMNKNLAKKIFDIGKSLNFLRFCCNDVEWVVEQGRIANLSHALDHNDLDKLEVSIDAVYVSTTKRVTDLLYEKFDLQAHLHAMKKYLLLSQGDFIQVLMDSIGILLSKPASTLHRHNLTANLETAIRSSNAQFDNPGVLRRLDLRIAETSPGDQGWDVFGLDYHVDMPISTVFTAQAMKKYHILFNFLFKLKRVEHTLSRGWQKQIKHAKLLASLSDTEYIAKVCRINWNEMLHFIYQFQYYIQFEVIECAWAELMQQTIQLKGGLDGLIAAHNKFLNSILSRGLLVSGTQQLTPRLESIFRIILAFKNSQEELYEYAIIQQDIVKREGKSNQQRKLNAAWGLVDSEYDTGISRHNPSREHYKTLEDIVNRIQASFSNFKNEAQSLVKVLTHHSDESMKLLSFRLNFNEYYHTDEDPNIAGTPTQPANPFET